MEVKLCPCGNKSHFIQTGFGLDTCVQCGLCRRGSFAELNQYVSADRIMHSCTYTKRKRFKKYIMRTNRHQSVNTVPPETWSYLIQHGPYKTPEELHRQLKRAKGLKRKCYDSIPLMCAHLCNQPVPSLTSEEIKRAMYYFDTIERHLHGEPMISYLFCLEFILRKLDRTDMIAFINRIKCPKRRRTYHERLTNIFLMDKEDVVTLLMATPN